MMPERGILVVFLKDHQGKFDEQIRAVKLAGAQPPDPINCSNNNNGKSKFSKRRHHSAQYIWHSTHPPCRELLSYSPGGSIRREGPRVHF